MVDLVAAVAVPQEQLVQEEMADLAVAVVLGNTAGMGGFGATDGEDTIGGVGAALGGAIFIEGTGTLELQGTVTFTDNDVEEGLRNMMSVGGQKLGKDIFMMTGSNLRVNSASSITINNPIHSNEGNQLGETTAIDYSIEGLGGITKLNSGTFTLKGVHTYSGDTTISGGVLRYESDDDGNASVKSSIAVNSGGILDIAATNFTITGLAAGTAAEYGTAFTATDGNLTLSGGRARLLEDATLTVTDTLAISNASSVLDLSETTLSSDTTAITVNSGGLFSHSAGTLLLTVDANRIANKIAIPTGATFGGMLSIRIPSSIDILNNSDLRTVFLNSVDVGTNTPTYIYTNYDSDDINIFNDDDSLEIEATLATDDGTNVRQAITFDISQVLLNTSRTITNSIEANFRIERGTLNIEQVDEITTPLVITGSVAVNSGGRLAVFGGDSSINISAGVTVATGGTISFNIDNIGNSNILLDSSVGIRSGSTLEIILPNANLYPATNISLVGNGMSSGLVTIASTATSPNEILFSSEASSSTPSMTLADNNITVNVRRQDNANIDTLDFDIIASSLILRINTPYILPSAPINESAIANVAQVVLSQNFSQVHNRILASTSLEQTLFSLTAGSYASFPWVHARHMSETFNIITQKMLEGYIYGNKTVNIWGSSYGIFNLQKRALDNISEFDSYGGGAIFARDKKIGNCVYGIAIADTFSNIDWKAQGEGNINSLFGSLYAVYQKKHSFFELASLFGHNWQKATRTLLLSDNIDIVKSSPRSSFLSIHFGSSVNIPPIAPRPLRQKRRKIISPDNMSQHVLFIGMDYHFIRQSHVNESGSDILGIKLLPTKNHVFRFEGGFKFIGKTISNRYLKIHPYLSFSVISEFLASSGLAEYSFCGQRIQKLPINFFSSGLWSAAPSAGIFVTTPFSNFKFSCDYKGLYNRTGSVQQVSLSLNLYL